MLLSEIKQKGISKGDIWENALTGQRMLVKTYEMHNEPKIGHYSVLVHTHFSGHTRLVPVWHNDVNIFGRKIQTAGSEENKQTRSVNSSRQQYTEKASSNRKKESTENLEVDPADELVEEEHASAEWTEQQLGIPKDPADEQLEEDNRGNH